MPNYKKKKKENNSNEKEETKSFSSEDMDLLEIENTDITNFISKDLKNKIQKVVGNINIPIMVIALEEKKTILILGNQKKKSEKLSLAYLPDDLSTKEVLQIKKALDEMGHNNE